jgi:hypothetical protein
MAEAVLRDEAPAATGTERVFAGYLAVQAVAGVAFWAILATVPAAREWLELMAEKHEVTDAFLLADAIVIVASAAGAWAVAGRRSWALPMVAFTAGGLVYPTLFLVCWVAFTGDGAMTLAVMVAPSSLTCWVAWQLWRTRSLTES